MTWSDGLWPDEIEERERIIGLWRAWDARPGMYEPVAALDAAVRPLAHAAGFTSTVMRSRMAAGRRNRLNYGESLHAALGHGNLLTPTNETSDP